MRYEENEIFSCDLSNFVCFNFVVFLFLLIFFVSFCVEKGFIVLEIQVLQEEIFIVGCKMRLSYLSSWIFGYKFVLRISFIYLIIFFNFMKVYFMVVVEGCFFRKWFVVVLDLFYYFIWDKIDVYNQKVFGFLEVFVFVGYEYEFCLDLILWEKRIVVLQGYEIDVFKFGGWSLDKYYVFNI